MIIEILNPYTPRHERWRKELQTFSNPQKIRFRDLLKWTFDSIDLTVEQKENFVDELIPYVRKETLEK